MSFGPFSRVSALLAESGLFRLMQFQKEKKKKKKEEEEEIQSDSMSLLSQAKNIFRFSPKLMNSGMKVCTRRSGEGGIPSDLV